MIWQFNWRCWHLGYNKVPDDDLPLFHNYLFIGPLQVKWYSS